MPKRSGSMGSCWRNPFLSSSTESAEVRDLHEGSEKRLVRISKGIKGLQFLMAAFRTPAGGPPLDIGKTSPKDPITWPKF